MIVTSLKGGLGNQMFQYATGYALSQQKKTDLYLDTRYFDDKLNHLTNKNYVKRKFQLNLFKYNFKIANKKIFNKFGLNNSTYIIRYLKIRFLSFFFPEKFYYEKNLLYIKDIFSLKKKIIYLDGYWQNEKYFINYKKNLKKIFIFKIKKKTKKNLNFIKKIKKINSVCINVRRGDFINNENNLAKEYYLRSIKLILKKFKKVQFYIFSDDVSWCKKNFRNMKINYKIVDHSYAGVSFTNYFYLMTNFKIFIISNSTFSWWAAWLSKYKNPYVIAPKDWFPKSKKYIDIVPHYWIKI
jgi:hypothetical protein